MCNNNYKKKNNKKSDYLLKPAALFSVMYSLFRWSLLAYKLWFYKSYLM